MKRESPTCQSLKTPLKFSQILAAGSGGADLLWPTVWYGELQISPRNFCTTSATDLR